MVGDLLTLMLEWVGGTDRPEPPGERQEQMLTATQWVMGSAHTGSAMWTAMWSGILQASF